jgi:hypothetical protein
MVNESELKRKEEANEKPLLLKVLFLLNLGSTAKEIGGKYGLTPRQVRYMRDRAIELPADTIVELPESIQNYIIEENNKRRRRRELRVQLEDLRKRALSRAPLSPLEKKRHAHFDNLAEAAIILWKKLINIRQLMLDTDETIHDFGLEERDYNLLAILDDFHVQWLFSHLKTELPELRGIKGWGDLEVSSISQPLLKALASAGDRREFGGKCEGCPPPE